MIPAEAVEAAAKWLHDNDCRSSVHSGFPADIACYAWLQEARELLEVAVPHVLKDLRELVEGMEARHPSDTVPVRGMGGIVRETMKGML